MTDLLIGSRIERKEDRRFLTGAGQYTDDITLPRQSFACFLRSPYAHARIRSISVDAARKSPGVLAIYTGADRIRMARPSQPNEIPLRRTNLWRRTRWVFPFR